MCLHSLFCFCNPPAMLPRADPAYPSPVWLWCLVSSLVSRVLSCCCDEGSNYQEWEHKRRRVCSFVVCPCFEQVIWCFNMELLFCLKLMLLPLFVFYSGFILNFTSVLTLTRLDWWPCCLVGTDPPTPDPSGSPANQIAVIMSDWTISMRSTDWGQGVPAVFWQWY